MKVSLSLAASVASTLLWVNSAQAQRYIVVNGTRMAPEAVNVLDYLTCSTVPNGRYWLNTNTGVWGYEGWPVSQGYLWENCRRRRQSLSERRQLFSTWDWLR